jgi:hypothetical protein
MDIAKKLINALDPKYILKQDNLIDTFGKRLTRKFHKNDNRIKSVLSRALSHTKKEKQLRSIKGSRQLVKPNNIHTASMTENPMRSKTT